MDIRPATPADADAIWHILESVLRAGETYALDRDLSRDDAVAFWLGGDRQSFVAIAHGMVVGTYYLRANQAGGGAHIANCGYATLAEARGRGVARAMAVHSFAEARARGFRAMQFNFVVSSNVPAVRLWHALGFETVGRVPEAFDHPERGLVDALILYRRL
ncbi:GNAT family N-acetyltransferase [Sphingomonas pokkalii]|uniref:GNAT family N-acetyltransferase n=1 Tax=Sphingomonas pokkalii TaxID=2175090 RepID=A0A2U0SG75_9SPHN|nr:GNAT family N-acetyltransferase [Sphingomonas pokkalii]PVX30294.1 GNAT family N-acetyltransferase [Sphingomonas pokkalii]